MKTLTRIALVTGLVAATAAATMVGGAPSPAAAAPLESSCRRPLAAGLHTVDVDQGGVERPFELYVPAGYRGRRVPLLLLLHASTSSGAEMINVPRADGTPMWLRHADDHGYAIAAPTGSVPIEVPQLGTGYRWNEPANPAFLDEVAYLGEVLDAASDTICVDQRRIYAMGASSGGLMASRLGCALADRLAAIAPLLATAAPDDCSPAEPMPVVAMHGRLDPRVPWERSATAVRRWAAINGCRTDPRVESETPNVDLWRFRGCDAGAQVSFFDVHDGGHTFPGGPVIPPEFEPLVGPTNRDLAFPDALWRLLRRHGR